MMQFSSSGNTPDPEDRSNDVVVGGSPTGLVFVNQETGTENPPRVAVHAGAAEEGGFDPKYFQHDDDDGDTTHVVQVARIDEGTFGVFWEYDSPLHNSPSGRMKGRILQLRDSRTGRPVKQTSMVSASWRLRAAQQAESLLAGECGGAPMGILVGGRRGFVAPFISVRDLRCDSSFGFGGELGVLVDWLSESSSSSAVVQKKHRLWKCSKPALIPEHSELVVAGSCHAERRHVLSFVDLQTLQVARTIPLKLAESIGAVQSGFGSWLLRVPSMEWNSIGQVGVSPVRGTGKRNLLTLWSRKEEVPPRFFQIPLIGMEEHDSLCFNSEHVLVCFYDTQSTMAAFDLRKISSGKSVDGVPQAIPVSMTTECPNDSDGGAVFTSSDILSLRRGLVAGVSYHLRGLFGTVSETATIGIVDLKSSKCRRKTKVKGPFVGVTLAHLGDNGLIPSSLRDEVDEMDARIELMLESTASSCCQIQLGGGLEICPGSGWFFAV